MEHQITLTTPQPTAAEPRAPGHFSRRHTVFSALSFSCFLCLMTVVAFMANIYAYEFGHGISSELAAGWQNNFSLLGETFYLDPGYVHWLQNYLAALHIPMQQYLQGDTPARFDTIAFIQALFQQQPGFFWGIAGAFLFQAALSLVLLGYSCTRIYARSASSAGKLFLSIFLVIALADLSMRLLNVFTDGEGDDLWLLKVGRIGNNWLLLGAIALAGLLLAALALSIGRKRLAEGLEGMLGLSVGTARYAALVFTSGMLIVNFGLRLHLSALLLPGAIYGVVFFLLFLAVAGYSGLFLAKSARASNILVRIPGHFYVCYGALLVCGILFLLLGIGMVIGANPESILTFSHL